MAPKKEVEPAMFTWPEKSKGFVDLHENVFYFYGPPKIGKSTLASQFPGALFLLTEDGCKHLSVEAFHIRKWTDFLAVLAQLEDAYRKHSLPYKTIVVDTVDLLAQYCDTFICEKHGVATLADVEWGRASAQYKKEFIKQVDRLTKLRGVGLIFVSHATEKEFNINTTINPYALTEASVETGKVRMTVPNLDGKLYLFIAGLADMILYLDIGKENRRLIYSKPTKYFEAGDRSGRMPAVIDMGYENIVNAYYGDKTVLTGRIERGEAYLAEHQIDSFESQARVAASRNAHLGTEVLAEASTVKLQEYLQHLTIKVKGVKNG